ncbi:MAG: ferric reductase-like transmembrane domain-containing protein [Bacteroidia bacterium]|nr:ferric reductase-like transmembrane domain-containing protein [Bacteroidia bacterium]
MSVHYQPVLWNRQKRLYDQAMLAVMGLYLLLFTILQLRLYPDITPETLIIRATGTLAYVMLHVILSIGPLARLDVRFLPLLYNRRHLGVTMFFVALVHGLFNLIQFHSQGNTDPLVSLLTSNLHYNSLSRFPFEVLGLIALLILFLMAATSHDFWLKNLSPGVWKSLHMMVYVAYALLVMHVMLGALQLEKDPLWLSLISLGLLTVLGLHLAAAASTRRLETPPEGPDAAGFVRVCDVHEIPDNRAKTLIAAGQNIAVFKYQGQLAAVSNRCRHQNGPLGEGKIVDGCITCPWHGYQYLPHNGQSPPPFTEKVETYDVKIIGSTVWVHPSPYPEGTERPPVQIPAAHLSSPPHEKAD